MQGPTLVVPTVTSGVAFDNGCLSIAPIARLRLALDKRLLSSAPREGAACLLY